MKIQILSPGLRSLRTLLRWKTSSCGTPTSDLSVILNTVFSQGGLCLSSTMNLLSGCLKKCNTVSIWSGFWGNSFCLKRIKQHKNTWSMLLNTRSVDKYSERWLMKITMINSITTEDVMVSIIDWINTPLNTTVWFMTHSSTTPSLRITSSRTKVSSNTENMMVIPCVIMGMVEVRVF